MKDLIDRRLAWSRQWMPRHSAQDFIGLLQAEICAVHQDPGSLDRRITLALLLMDLWDRGWAAPLEHFPVEAWNDRLPVLCDFCVLMDQEAFGVAGGIPGVTHPLYLLSAISICFADFDIAEDVVMREIGKRL